MRVGKENNKWKCTFNCIILSCEWWDKIVKFAIKKEI